MLVMQFIKGTATENQRSQANREGTAIQVLLAEGKPVKGIADLLSKAGGVAACLERKNAKSEFLPADANATKKQTPIGEEVANTPEHAVDIKHDWETFCPKPIENEAEGQEHRQASESTKRAPNRLRVPPIPNGKAKLIIEVENEDLAGALTPGKHSIIFRVEEEENGFKRVVALKIDPEEEDPEEE